MSLKILFNTIMSNEDCFTSITEAKFLKKFNNPYIIEYTDCFIEKDLFCIVLEYCDVNNFRLIFCLIFNRLLFLFFIIEW